MQGFHDRHVERRRRTLHDSGQLLHDRILTEQAILPVPFTVARSGFVLCPEPPLAIGLDEASRLFSSEAPDADSQVELSVRWGDLSHVRRGASCYDSGGSWA